MKKMKIISWNVNGLKSAISKGLDNKLKELNADIICIQETKITSQIDDFVLDNYYTYFNFSKRAGYSGVAIFSKIQAENVILGMELENDYGEIENVDSESRVIIAEFNDFFVVSVYVPCSTSNQRKEYRTQFENNFCEYINKLNNIKDVIVCGDFNICYKDIDICNLEKHEKVEYFSDEDRGNFNELLDVGLIDSYRYMHPQMRKYTFWTNDIKDRNECKYGWRLDYILVSEYLKKHIREANILTNIEGSDHCPAEIVLDLY